MKWVGLFAFGIIGAILLTVGVTWGLRRINLYREGVQTEGTVVAIEASTSTSRENGQSRTSTSYYPVVEFHGADGAVHKVRGSTGSSSPDFEVGDKTQVIYRPANPHDAMIAGFEQFWLGPIGVTVFGLLLLGAGFASFFLVRSNDATFGPAFHADMDRAQLVDMKQGVKIHARVSDVRERKSGGRTAFVLECQAAQPNGEVRTFLSPPLQVMPEGSLLGKAVDVYVDPVDDKHFYVDVKALFAPASTEA